EVNDLVRDKRSSASGVAIEEGIESGGWRRRPVVRGREEPRVVPFEVSLPSRLVGEVLPARGASNPSARQGRRTHESVWIGKRVPVVLAGQLPVEPPHHQSHLDGLLTDLADDRQLTKLAEPGVGIEIHELPPLIALPITPDG